MKKTPLPIKGDTLRVLELGNYVVPAYAGMILAEQGHDVIKWTKPDADPILECHRGEELWDWLNEGKDVAHIHPSSVIDAAFEFDVVIDNFRPATLEKWEIDPAAIARDARVSWVSMRSDCPELHDSRSFDIVAQARSTMEFADWIPFWLGDTAGGLLVAFKALSMAVQGDFSHATIEQAGTLQKLVEGELVIEQDRDRYSIPWESQPYRREGNAAIVEYGEERIEEPIRDREWKLKYLRHDSGRIII